MGEVSGWSERKAKMGCEGDAWSNDRGFYSSHLGESDEG